MGRYFSAGFLTQRREKTGNMTSNKEKLLAYAITLVMLLIGVVGYAAFDEKAPNTPYRILFQSMAGKVQFDHMEHVGDYGLSCNDCHHNLSEGETEPDTCGSCHLPDADDPIKRSEAFHNQCIGCHQGGGPTKCNGCHLL